MEGHYRPSNDRERERVVSALRQVLAAGYPGLALAYLHGSFVRGPCYEDLDVALLLDEVPTSGLPPSDLASRLACAALPGVSLDVRLLNGSSPGFRFAVIGAGRQLYARTRSERVAFETLAVREWLDFRPLYNQAAAALRRSVAERWGRPRVRMST